MKAKPKHRRGGANNKPHEKPKTEKAPTEANAKPQQKSTEAKEGGDKKRSRHRYYHRGKLNNKQGGEQKQ